MRAGCGAVVVLQVEGGREVALWKGALKMSDDITSELSIAGSIFTPTDTHLIFAT